MACRASLATTSQPQRLAHTRAYDEIMCSDTPSGSANNSAGQRYHRPVLRGELDEEDKGLDPAARAELAHDLATLLVNAPGVERNAESAHRFVTLAEEYGLETVAGLWASAPPVSLPGSLWRLYALRAWIRNDSQQASQWFTTGLGVGAGDSATAGRLTVPRVVAGVEEPPGPAEVARVADEILTGAFLGDFGDALSRAAAFVAVAAAGRAALGTDEQPEGLRRFATLAEDLSESAHAYRAGTLD